MRNIVFHFEDSPAFALALRDGDQELSVPEGERVGDGEWVLAIFEVGKKRRATAAAARGLLSETGEAPLLAFERRDWERLVLFAEAGSVNLRAAPVSTAPTSVPPARSSSARVPAASASSSRMPPSSSRMPPSSSRIPPSSSRKPPAAKTRRSRAPAASPPDGACAPPSSAKVRPGSGEADGATPTLPERGRNPGDVPSKSAAASPAKTPSFAHWRASDPLAQGPSARILVVDDDRDIREVVGAMLDAVGLTVESAMSAEEALERVRADRYDLLVLDWNLPGMTGIELCRLIRRDPELSTLPVLFLTAHASSRDVVEAFAVGADDYVVKPFRAPELGARIFGLLRRARMAAPIS